MPCACPFSLHDVDGRSGADLSQVVHRQFVKPGELLDLLGLDRTVFLQKMTRVTTCWSGT
jgi:hypothetical protein